MKKYFYLLLFLIGSNAVAQEFKGVAEYQSVTTRKNATIKMTGVDPAMEAQMKEALSKPIENSYILYFDKTASVYEMVVKLNPNAPAGMRPFTPGKRYNNLKEGIVLYERELYDKEFIVQDSLEKPDWKLENETKKIGNYTCYKATYTIVIEPPKADGADKAIDLMASLPRREIVVTAWYAPEIPVSHGPSEYWGLPGLILGISTDNMTMLCTKLTLNPKEKVEVKAPSKGQKVTQEKFNEIGRKKSEEMKDLYAPKPGSKSMTITIGG
ncbi:GLPGLI family protein [Flavobacterium sp. MFBS3-15]|uniref:GLPGLI family protein n=1 Tax=Flavobacterium sp. MFBS3-15 TaxID=2989816 RepID=UPI0022367C65|nr:GLPGLI family protein [Flavobacterium sp. MFBS3-15]MCW4468748.1 GLPGLI family protein [Flavobacterium sp. MFBS3-15]